MTQDDQEKITWDDLLIQNNTPDEAADWIADWQWFIDGQIMPIFVTRFRNWFFKRPNGRIEYLDVCEGIVETISADYESLVAAVNTPRWQEQHLYNSPLVQYRRKGIVACGRNAIAFVPHPRLAPSLDACEVMVMDMKVWQTICGQLMRQISGAEQPGPS